MFRIPTRRVHGLVAVLVLAVGLVASGCGQIRAGAAALVGDQRIAVEELAQSVRATQQAATRNGLRLPDRAALVRAVLSRQIVGAILDESAERKGITVTRREVRQRIAQLGGRQRPEPQAVRRAIPPEELDDYIRRRIIAERLARSLGPGGDARARPAALLAYLRRLARGMDITVSPRYGKFDAGRLAVVPEKSALSTPDEDAAGGTGLGGLGGLGGLRSGG